MVSNQILTLILTGLSLGVVHVLTGPDHLSAIATLSANVRYAFWLGVRWGVGHSTGLLLVGCLVIVWDSNNNNNNNKTSRQQDEDGDADTIQVPEHVSHAFEGLVGVFMLLLGLYGLHKAWGKRPTSWYDSVLLIDDEENSNVNSPQDDTTAENVGEENNDNMEDSCKQNQPTERSESNATTDTILLDIEGSVSSSDNDDHASTVSISVSNTTTNNNNNNNTPLHYTCLQTLSIRTMATAAGIVHGLAGPGGVLGVIPAVQLHDARLACLYLACFCTSSTLTMGLFAAMYGNCSAHLAGGMGGTTIGRREFIIQTLSAMLSIVVGLLWLILLSLGKLDDVFP